MEYDFYRTPDGLFEAEFSTEQEYFGHWLTYQLSTDKSQIVELLNTITQLKKRQLKDHKIVGAEYTLMLNQDEALIYTNAKPVLKNDPQNAEDLADDDSDEASATNDAEVSPDLLENGCGIDDFEKVVQAWLNFIQE